jgi:HD-GYP domain-containing protein (c-di-GMP phosphodiesterase class II)
MQKRPYREALSRDEAIKIIKEDSENKWSNKLAKEFIAVLKEDLGE